MKYRYEVWATDSKLDLQEISVLFKNERNYLVMSLTIQVSQASGRVNVEMRPHQDGYSSKAVYINGQALGQDLTHFRKWLDLCRLTRALALPLRHCPREPPRGLYQLNQRVFALKGLAGLLLMDEENSCLTKKIYA